MTLITIHEHSNASSGSNAVITIEGRAYLATVSDPFTEAEAERLEWYFERYMRSPLTNQIKAQEAKESVTTYGEALFRQLFADPAAYTHYQARLQEGLDKLIFAIVGSPEFHQWHWEALKDPDLPQPFTLLAPMVRQSQVSPPLQASLRPSPTINLLLVIARPDRQRDAGYRTISRPLVERLRQTNLPVQIEIVRPGTYKTLVQHLEETRDRYGSGYYHVVHFDVHGALLSYDRLQQEYKDEHHLTHGRYGRNPIKVYEGVRAFLFFETDQAGRSDPAEDGELADLLISHQIPIAILNACQSGKQIGTPETSLGSRLMQAGLQVVLTMGYSVTVSAAELFMQTFYNQLFAGHNLLAAIRRARLELYNYKTRRAFFDETIELEDWLLPVVYSAEPSRPLTLQLRAFTPQERVAYYERQAIRYRPPELPYGFIGRDLDILHIEKHLLTRHNILLVCGMGGVGKTTLLHHLGSWWQTTGFVNQVFYFGYDQRAWTHQQIMIEIARRLLGETRYYTEFQPMSPEAQQALLTERLRAERHLLILDNLESITGTHLAIQNMLSSAERAALCNFLADLLDGQTLLLFGSRGEEAWLTRQSSQEIKREPQPPQIVSPHPVYTPPPMLLSSPALLHTSDVYELSGLDPEAASILADRILERHNATQYRQDSDFQRLLELLNGYPLPLEVVLANLTRQTPSEILAALRAGDVALDISQPQIKTESILRCIDYSHSNLSPEAQKLLMCLAPFTSVINIGLLEQYTDYLRQQPILSHLPFEQWSEVLQEAQNWGLLRPHSLSGYLHLHPIFPYFLRSYLNKPAQVEIRHAVETAFRHYADGLADALGKLLKSKKAKERQLGQTLVGLEYENLVTALNLSLGAQVSIINPYLALSRYLDATRDQRRGLALGQAILAQLTTEQPTTSAAQPGTELVSIFDDLAKRQLMLKQYSAAKVSYEQTLELVTKLENIDHDSQGRMTASIYHQLGLVAEAQQQWNQARQYYRQALEIRARSYDLLGQASTHYQLGRIAEGQRQWEEAEQYYQQALALFVEDDDPYKQAMVYHQLGVIAEAQRRWDQAERHYQQALKIFKEYKDRYQQALTYRQLGVVAQARQQWTQAEQYYQQTLEIFIEYHDQSAQADAYLALGIVAQEQQQWTQTEQYYRQALAIKVESNDQPAQAVVYHNLGMVAQAQEQWIEAERYYRRALRLKVESNNYYAQATTYHQLGMVAQAKQQWEEAKQHYRQALEIKLKYNDRPAQASTYGQLGLLAEAQQDWSQTQHYLLQALEIFHEIGDEQNVNLTLYNLTRLWQAGKEAGLLAAIASILKNTPEEIGRRFQTPRNSPEDG